MAAYYTLGGAWTLLLDGTLLHHAAMTLYRMMCGFGLAVVVADVSGHMLTDGMMAFYLDSGLRTGIGYEFLMYGESRVTPDGR